MTKILKCNTCNIVINEVLTFIDCKSQVMDNESLIRLCRTSFSVQEIEDAKSLLFESVQTDKRKISRRKDGKVERDLQDIITVFKETDPEKIPVFVARELHRLPPVTFDHIDATRLLKDILVMKEELTTLKAEMVTKDMLQEAMVHRDQGTVLASKSFVPEYRAINVNLKRGGGVCEYMNSFQLDSGPTGLINVSKPENSVENMFFAQTITSTPSHSNSFEHQLKLVGYNGQQTGSAERLSAGPCMSPPPATATVPPGTPSADVNKHENTQCADISQDPRDKVKTAADIVKDGGKWKNANPDEAWITVQRKRLRNRFIGRTGSASTELSGKFKAAEIKIPILVYNVDKGATEEDVKDYIFSKTRERVSLYKLRMQREKSYDSYKLFVAKNKLSLYLDEKLWPSDIKFRQFIRFNKTTEDKRNNT